uniref:BLE2 protein-like protein n=1 Tax=Oryza sativa subsp. japonica TaxID=39947 RepID=Q5QL69_ORYSJ|nr:BLE2 protein-like protein [Oryza sativa Japonica Group]
MALRLFSSAVDPRDQFILNAPEVVAAETERFEAMENGSWQRHISINRQVSSSSVTAQGLRAKVASYYAKRCSCGFFLAKLLLMGFALVLYSAAVASVVLAALRLSKQDYVDPADQGSSDHKSIKGSLNLFYGLVLVQGASDLLAQAMFTVADIQLVLKITEAYQLGPLGKQMVSHYMLVTYLRCSGGNVREAMNMDLVSFAMELVRSNSIADRLVGVGVLDSILRVPKYRALALMRLRASADTVGGVVSMLGLTNNTRKEVNTRGHAAGVILELSRDLLLESFPAMLPIVSSLIVAADNSGNDVTVSMEFTWFGVKILNKIMDNPDNCNKVADADGQVIASIVNLTAVTGDDRSLSIVSSSAVRDEEIILEAVQVLHKLVSAAGDSGRVLRCKVSDNVYVLRNISKILQHPRSQVKLLVEAIGVLACLALDETGREEIASSPQIIRKLVSFLVPRSQMISEISADRRQLAKPNAEALVMLAMDNQSIVWKIQEELKPQDMQKLVEMLSADSTGFKTNVAKLSGILHANSRAEHAHLQKTIINTALPTNFQEWRTKQGALLESFVGLSVQICTSIHASDFNEALRSANVTVYMVMQKLRKILDLYKSPAIEFPGIRRVAVELIIWMKQCSSHCNEVFFQCEMDKALKEVAGTEERLEMFKIFYYGVGIVKHSEPISSLVNLALGL